MLEPVAQLPVVESTKEVTDRIIPHLAAVGAVSGEVGTGVGSGVGVPVACPMQFNAKRKSKLKIISCSNRRTLVHYSLQGVSHWTLGYCGESER